MQTVWVKLLDALEANGKTWEDVKFITKLGRGISKEEFKEQAKTHAMDNAIDPSLKVVGEGWWLEVEGYVWGVWFEFKMIPAEPRQMLKNPSILYNGQEDLWY